MTNNKGLKCIEAGLKKVWGKEWFIGVHEFLKKFLDFSTEMSVVDGVDSGVDLLTGHVLEVGVADVEQASMPFLVNAGDGCFWYYRGVTNQAL